MADDYKFWVFRIALTRYFEIMLALEKSIFRFGLIGRREFNPLYRWPINNYLVDTLQNCFPKASAWSLIFRKQSNGNLSTSAIPTPLARLPLRPCIRLPQLESLDKLFFAHQILASRFNLSNEIILPAKGQELAMLKRERWRKYINIKYKLGDGF